MDIISRKPKQEKPSGIAEALGDEGRIAFQRAVRQVNNKPAADYLPRHRAVAKLMSALQHDTPERKALATMAGVDEADISPHLFARFADGLLKEYDRDQFLETHWEAELEERARPADNGESNGFYGLQTQRGSEVLREPMEWLWEQRIPLSGLTFLAGDPDAGKTWIALYIAAAITTGRDYPDAPASFPERKDVLYMGIEDTPSELVARLEMMGGDPSRLHIGSEMFVPRTDKKGNLIDGPDVTKTFNLKAGMQWLSAKLDELPGIALVIIDPLLEFVAGANSNDYTKMKETLRPLIKLAFQRKLAILGLSHLSKDSNNTKSIYRIMGSMGLVATARAAWAVLVDGEDDAGNDRRLFLKVKCNSRTCKSDEYGSMAFHISNGHGVVWDGAVDTTADELLEASSPAKPRRETKQARAEAWLTDYMTPGTVYDSKPLMDEATQAGFSESTVRRAWEKLEVDAEKIGKGWKLTMPKKKSTPGDMNS